MNPVRSLTIHHFVRSAILFGFAMLIVYFVKSENILLYIAPRMVIYVKLSAIGLYAIAIYQLYLAIRSLQGKTAACDCSHAPSSSWLKNGILYGLFVFPLLLAVLLPNTTMGSSLAAKKGMNLSSANNVKSNSTENNNTSTSSPNPAINDSNSPELRSGSTDSSEQKMMGLFPYDKYTEHFAKHAVHLHKMDVIQIPEDSYMESLTTLDLYNEQFKGKKIEIIGFVYREDDMQDNQFVIGRFSIQCCSADAAPFGVLTEFERAATYADDTWVKITGTINKAKYNNNDIMTIKAQKIEKIEPPKNQYVYPNFEFGS